jgi:hypothetical protein
MKLSGHEEILDFPGRLFCMDHLLFIQILDRGFLGLLVEDVKEKSACPVNISVRIMNILLFTGKFPAYYSSN